LSLTGQFNTITWSAVTGAKYYNVYKEWAQSGRYYLIGSSVDNTVGVTDDNIIPDFEKAPPEATSPFGTSDGTTTLPSTGTFFQQRSYSAAPEGDPQRFWSTRIGSTKNMNVSQVPQDDDPFNYRLAGTDAHTIRHLVPFSRLLALTGTALWKFSAGSGGALSPLDINADITVEIGSTDTRPVKFREYLLYADARGEHLIGVKFSQEAGGYDSQDLSLEAPHLIDNYTWVQMGFQKAPYPTWWGVRSDGKLIGMTFSPKQNIAAWHQHEFGGTNATVESLAIIPETGTSGDVIYVVVRRTIGGVVVRHIEFIKSRSFPDLAHSFCVDSGLMYDGAPATTFSGFDHLEGETIAVLADGVATTKLVVGGEITTDEPVSVLIGGLPYNCDAKRPPLSYAGYRNPAAGTGQKEVVSNVRLRVVKTAGLYVGSDFDSLQAFTLDPLETYGLRNKIIETGSDFGWDEDSEICIRQSLPLPATITAMAVDFAEGN
jgi:hypothetical protein